MLDYASPATEGLLVHHPRSEEVVMMLPPRTLRHVLAQNFGAMFATGAFLALATFWTVAAVVVKDLQLGGTAIFGALALVNGWGIWSALRREPGHRPFIGLRKGRLVFWAPTQVRVDLPYTDLRSISVKPHNHFWSRILLGSTAVLAIRHAEGTSLVLEMYKHDLLETVAHELRQAVDAAGAMNLLPAEQETERFVPPVADDGFVAPPFVWPKDVPRTLLRTDAEEQRLAEARREHWQRVNKLHDEYRRSGAFKRPEHTAQPSRLT